jgi:ubiquitin-conjugating enzyme E2 G2
MSMLAEPNVESGANIDCCKQWRNDRAAFDARVLRTVEKSLGLRKS